MEVATIIYSVATMNMNVIDDDLLQNVTSGFRPPPPPPPPQGSVPDYSTPRNAHFIFFGIIIPLGLIFNILSIIVFASSQQLHKTTTGHYLMALAIADTLFLIGEFLRWLNTPHMGHLGVMIDFMETNNSVCKLVFLWRYTAKLASAWITVAITMERFVTVAFPLKVARISTPRIAKIMIGMVFGVSLLLSLFPIWSVGSILLNGIVGCAIIDHYWYNIGSWISLRIGSLVLPGIIMLVFTILICIFLSRAKKVRTRKLSTNNPPKATSVKKFGRQNSHQLSTGSHSPTKVSSVRKHGRQISRQYSTPSIERQLTMMLVTVAIAFIILRLPYTVAYYINLYKRELYPNMDMWQNYHIYYAYKVTDVIASINYAVNFFLYCCCGGAFRKQLRDLFRKKTSRKAWLGHTTASSSLYSKNGSLRLNAYNQLSPDANKAMRTALWEKSQQISNHE